LPAGERRKKLPLNGRRAAARRKKEICGRSRSQPRHKRGNGMKGILSSIIFAGALAVGAGAAQAQQPAGFWLKSETFKDGEMMPRKVANKNAQNPNCVGENVSPQLSWTGAPAGTKSFAITMIDPEGRGGAGVHHFIAYGIPPDVTSFAEGELSKESPKYVGGKSTQGVGYFSGPCTPPGSPHHYTFLIIATDFEPKELPPGLTIPEFWEKLSQPGKAKGSAGLVGLFVKPAN
jgi:Raf kinase inhibitor-like YbhB/YbcL family protein